MLSPRALATRPQVWLLAVCLLGSACSSSDKDSGGDTGSDLSGGVSCKADTRVEPYAAGREKAGESGMLSFKLVESTPAPPAKGSNAFTLAVTHANGDPADVELTVDLKMPDHGHGTSVVPKIAFDSDAQVFTVDPLYLFMAGVWRIDFHATESGADEPLDSASFFFCIEG